MRKIAKALGGELVNQSYGHYDVSGFIRRNDKYVYFSYSNSLNYGGRTYVALKENNSYSGCCTPLLIRTAKNDSDYRGGYNNFTSFENCQSLIERLLNE